MDPSGTAERLVDVYQQDNERWTAEHTAICEIPAPPFGEGPRGDHFEQRLLALGLADVTYDEVGNVYGRYPLSGDGPRLAVSAHLDTVFGPEVDCRVRRQGEVLRAPGISDDCAGLTMLLALADTLRRQEVRLPGELWLVATVGEEGPGNLRGARKIASDGVRGQRLDAFITLDTGRPGQIIRHGTFSSNHDLTLRGPGGHAWGDYGVANPALTLARIVARVSEYEVPTSPRTTINCGILEAGIAPNAIPQAAHGHLNLRSESGEHLQRLVAHAETAMREELARANQQRRLGPELQLEQTVSERPGGKTAATSPLVRAAIAAVQRLDCQVTHPYSSTDANAFMAEDIDAICMYHGDGGGSHTPAEWYDSATRPEALRQLTETVLGYFRLAT